MYTKQVAGVGCNNNSRKEEKKKNSQKEGEKGFLAVLIYNIYSIQKMKMQSRKKNPAEQMHQRNIEII